MTGSFRSCVSMLLMTLGADRSSFQTYGDTSLLCVDYKIGTKALAARLQKVLSSVLHEDQTCSVPGRSIFSNLNLVRDLIEYCNSKSLPLAIINLDQEKAFDRVNWNFLDRVLQRMNFGPEFRQWLYIPIFLLLACIQVL